MAAEPASVSCIADRECNWEIATVDLSGSAALGVQITMVSRVTDVT